ncbi:uncharacterized protein LOC116014024 [Ipomoea triloba]|uniref:uncharacterized protein LOC116014024 n=1 Tax=Ipomoea triloba TaxID=35885 RepID=UPI00125E0282|nr:uncharacterized protein LOC116014024 [Ipomoea triloba]
MEKSAPHTSPPTWESNVVIPITHPPTYLNSLTTLQSPYKKHHSRLASFFFFLTNHLPGSNIKIEMVMMGLERLVVSLKTKLRRSVKTKNNSSYDKIEKSDSMRVEIRSRKAQKLIQETLKIADSPHTKSFPF